MNSFINIPEKFLDKWQEIANLLAKIIHVPAALIMKTENEFMEVFISSKSENNPYKPGDKEHWAGLYCETVIKSQHKLHVPNALKDKDWDKNPDIKLGMIAYLGLPLNFPDKTPFGTICVLDEKENKFTDEQEQLLHQFKNIIELDLALIQTLNIKESGNVIDELQQQKQELTTNKEEYEAINEELRQTNDELLQTKQIAEESEEKFRTIFNMSLSFICIADINTATFKFINPTFSRILGYSEEELLSKPFLEFIHPDDVKPTLEVIEKQLQAGSSVVSFENRYQSKKGEYRWLNWNSYPLPEKGITYAIALDITDQKTAEQALQESEAKFKGIFNHANIGIATSTMNGTISNVNKEFKKLLGYSESELLNMTFRDFTHPDDLDKENELINQLLTGEINNYRIEKRYIHKKGDVIWVDLSLAAMKDDSGESILFIGMVRDITEQSKAKEKLRFRESLFNKVLDTIPDMVSIHDKDLNILYSNWNGFGKVPVECRKFNTKCYKTYRNYDEICPDCQAVNVLKTKTPNHSEAELPDNSWIDLRVIPLIDENGETNMFVEWVRDITNVKESEIRLKEQNEEYLSVNEELRQTNEELIEAKAIAEENENKVRGMFRNTEMGLIFCNAEGQILEINKAIIDILGSPSIEATKQINLLTFKPLIDAGFSGKLQQSINERITISGELKYKSKWGLMVFMHYQLIPLVVHDKLIGVWINLNNLTDLWNSKQELIKAKEKAEESEAKLLDAQQLTHVGHWEYFIDSDTVIWSKELFNIFERPYDLSAPKYAEQRPYYKKESFAILDKAVQDCLQYGTPYEIELDIITSKGSIKHIISKGRLKKDADNRILSVYGTAQDITPQKKLELQLIDAKEKAEEANRLKTEFLNNMSHEIRTPMNGIIGFSEMLNNPNISKEKRKHYSKIVQNGSHQLLRIIDDILAISTLETKQEELNETAFCLNDLLMELFSIFNLKSKEKNIPLYLEKALHDGQSHIISDKTKLNKILGNLLENALKFTNKGFIEFGYYIEKANLILYVKDTGIGISPKNHHIIFERFSQEDKEMSRKYGGLGLGLSISKENAQLLGGDITLESEKEKGSTFYVRIPYKPAKKADKSPSYNKSVHLTKNEQYTILVAEDEEVNYLYIDALFEEEFDADYKLIHAKNGKEAVEICKQNKNIDLILMDIKMPVMNGHEASKKIKAIFPDIPIIAQTAYSTEFDKEQALQHGCDDFISKPIDTGKLYELINTYLMAK